MLRNELKVMIRGGGELATAVAHRLYRCHFKLLLAEIAEPQAVRREVAFCEAVYDGEKEVEEVTAKLISSPDEMAGVWQNIKRL